MKNKVKEIMDNYKKEVKKLDKKYEVPPVKKPNTKELENKIQDEKDFIAKLELEGEEINAKLIENAKERLDKAIKEKEEIDSKYQEELLKREKKLQKKEELKNSTVVLESRREVKMSEKDKMDKADLKDRAIRDLTKESQEISKQLMEKDKQLRSKRDEKHNFKPEYEKDSEGHVTKILNRDVILKINEDINKITEEMSELGKMQKECDKYLEELKAPSKEAKSFMETWKEAAKVEPGQPQPGQPQPAQPQPGQPQPGQPQPGQPQPGQPQPGQPQPGQPQPGQPQPGQPQPGQPQPGQPQPGQPQPGQPQPGQPQPAQPQPGQPQPTPTTPIPPKDVKINIGKEVTYSLKKDGKTIEGKFTLSRLKKQLDPNISISIARELRDLLGIKKDDKDYAKEMNEINKLSELVNPIVYEALRRIDDQIDKDKHQYTANYLNSIRKKDPSHLKTDIVYDENQYKKRNIFDRIKALPFINKSLNKKEIKTIEKWAEQDESDKMARVIRKNKKEPKKLNGAPEQQTHDEFVETLKGISKMKIDDPEDQLTAKQMEQKNIQRNAKRQQNSTDYLDRDW